MKELRKRLSQGISFLFHIDNVAMEQSFQLSVPFSGWWMVDAQGVIGWAPASYLVPVNESDLQEEAEENEQLIEQERGKSYPMYCSCLQPLT